MNLTLVTPEISLLVTAVLVILLDLFIQRKGWLAVISVIGLLVSAGFAVGLWNGTPQLTFNNMLAVDNFAVFFKLLFAGIAILVILASTDYVSKLSRFPGRILRFNPPFGPGHDANGQHDRTDFALSFPSNWSTFLCTPWSVFLKRLSQPKPH